MAPLRWCSGMSPWLETAAMWDRLSGGAAPIATHRAQEVSQ